MVRQERRVYVNCRGRKKERWVDSNQKAYPKELDSGPRSRGPLHWVSRVDFNY